MGTPQISAAGPPCIRRVLGVQRDGHPLEDPLRGRGAPDSPAHRTEFRSSAPFLLPLRHGASCFLFSPEPFPHHSGSWDGISQNASTVCANTCMWECACRVFKGRPVPQQLGSSCLATTCSSSLHGRSVERGKPHAFWSVVTALIKAWQLGWV